MAGSLPVTTEYELPDLSLTASLHVTRQLACHLRLPVVVIDREFNVVYTNQLGVPGSCQGHWDNGRDKCYVSFFQRREPCTFCPAIRVFEEGRPQTAVCSPGHGMFSRTQIQALPLVSASGKAEYVVELFSEAGSLPFARSQSPAIVKSALSDPLDESHDSGELCGRSAVMADLFAMIELVANSQVTALIQGESGTGKELVARTIHRRSPRRNHPFIVVDCGSLPETLLESELFGHVRGAFTGAQSSKKGLFEEAHEGTLFLDEIADTTPHFQSKLLRVIQEGEIKPVGSNRSIKVDVRIVSATNKNLHHLVRAGTFREDLFYRLAVLPITIPPLRDRREDIPLLVQHLMESACRQHGKPLRTVTPEALLALKEASWPGNVRELKHTIERAIVTGTGPHLTVQDFFPASGTAKALDSDLRSIARRAVGHAERARIQEALRQSGGNRAQAARVLKISRASLYNKLRDYRIDKG